MNHAEFTLPGRHHGRPFAADATWPEGAGHWPVVVFVHGFKGFKDWGHFPLLATYFASQGFIFVKLNLSHNGVVVGGSGDLEDLEAFGRNNFSLELNDLGELLDALHLPGATPVPPGALDLKRLYLIGHSRGGALVLLKAIEDERVRAVATWASVASLHPRWPAEVLDQWQREGVLYVPNLRTGQQLPLHYQIAEDYFANPGRLDLPALLPGLRRPVLLVHGEPDETVPLSAVFQLQQVKKDAEVLVLSDAPHNFGGSHPWPGAALPVQAQQAATHTAAFFARLT